MYFWLCLGSISNVQLFADGKWKFFSTPPMHECTFAWQSRKRSLLLQLTSAAACMHACQCFRSCRCVAETDKDLRWMPLARTGQLAKIRWTMDGRWFSGDKRKMVRVWRDFPVKHFLYVWAKHVRSERVCRLAIHMQTYSVPGPTKGSRERRERRQHHNVKSQMWLVS